MIRNFFNDATLVNDPVATIDIASTSEGGLLGIVLHPDFDNNNLFYLYTTVEEGGEAVNRVEQWKLNTESSTAQREKIIFSDIRASLFHNGGRMRIGPDDMLYVGTGDAREPDLSQDPQSPNGKILRLTLDGEIPDDNPVQGSPMFVMGIRNTQGWDWPDTEDANTLWIVDHGPSGEMGRSGHDEINVGMAGDNFGWPPVFGCQQQENLLPPVLTWQDAVPPGGAAVYSGNSISEWQGDFIVGTLGSRHLHRVMIEAGVVSQHEVYFQSELGRIREVIMAPDGELYITTSNCDGRGNCPPEGDKIIRITR